MLSIAGFTQDRGACTRLRIWQPLRKIGMLGLAKTHAIELSDGDPTEIIEDSDVVVFGRAAGENVDRVMENIWSKGKKIVFDQDDNFMDIQPMSPHYKDLGIMPVNMESPTGKVMEMWVDGKNGFDLKRSRRIRSDMIEVVRKADAMTVTTEPLRKEYARFNDNVYVVPNCLDFSIWDRQPIRRIDNDEIRILYTGASNHLEDFLYIRDQLVEIQKAYKKVKLVFVGMDWKHPGNNLDYSRVEVQPWTDFIAYPYLLKTLCCDIGLAPVTVNKFNDCRSSLKWMEYSALGLATIASNWGSYKRDVRDGETGLLVDSQDDWERAIVRLVENPEERKKLAENAYKEVKAKHNLDFTVDRWMEVFNKTKGDGK